MTIQVNVHEAKSRLSELMVAARRGDEVIIARAGKPEARLVPINEDAEREARIAAVKAWIGSGKDRFGPGAGELFLEPAFTDAELEAFEKPFDDGND